MIDRNEIFNKVFAHLVIQGKPSRNIEDYICVYQNSDGDKCAIGCLIPDELYTMGLEGNGVRDKKVKDVLRQVFPNIGLKDFEFLENLQQLHDDLMYDYEGVKSGKKYTRYFYFDLFNQMEQLCIDHSDDNISMSEENIKLYKEKLLESI